ncbi:hypothetical protein HanXRQr2_Chr16g0725851 [Helianthus annuus]|uniref:Uncharacterized protein n=1 Tax=Helianthus annuus TaxID=4232 RepID=A0A251RVM5_HELAN|nr:hypothetical protein HanXRQr2_Chr16g0725851 [Helianthus annuus]
MWHCSKVRIGEAYYVRFFYSLSLSLSLLISHPSILLSFVNPKSRIASSEAQSIDPVRQRLIHLQYSIVNIDGIYLMMFSSYLRTMSGNY